MSDNISQDVSIEGEGNIVIGKARDVIFNPLPPAETRLRHDLGILLRNVENTWIKGVLEKSVHEAALLELGMEIREEAVDNPWRLVMEGPGQARETLPWGKKIKDIFYEANGLLLILGEPGSGKTTTLLQLARDLIAEVDQAFTQPVPVILNLSTWTNKQQPLDDWLIAELNSKYRLPKKDGKRWLEDHRILLLLDGLDEVKLENRSASVQKINQLASEYGLPGLVVCSRLKDYTDLDVRLAFYRAIYLQPLTLEQIEEYLDRAGEKVASLRKTLLEDEALQSMAQSPLMLNIMSLAYQNASAADLNDPTFVIDKKDRRYRLFSTYIARMFNRKAGKRQYHAELTKQRLSWLARNMQRYNQEVFLIEGLQPSWLATKGWQWCYFLSSRVLSGFAAILIVRTLLDFEPLNELSEILIVGLVAGISVGIIDAIVFDWFSAAGKMKKKPILEWLVKNIGFLYLFLAVIVGYIWGFVAKAEYFDTVLLSLFITVIFGVSRTRPRNENDILPVDALRWSWRMSTKGGLISGIFGFLIGSVLTLYLQMQKMRAFENLLRDVYMPSKLEILGIVLYGGLGLSIIFGLIGGLFSGIRREIIATKSISNQGVQLSIRSAILGCISLGLIFGLIVGLISGFSVGLHYGLSFGLMGAIWYGGLDVIQHYILRLILIIQGHTPRNYARFLDYCVDRIFLQKVGGGYRFIHRLLLEHFASMTSQK